MSRAASPRPAWLRAALILLALLGAVLAPAAPTEAAPAPPAAISTEPTGEAHQDTAESALRVPTRRPAPASAAPAARPRVPHRSHPLPTRALIHRPAPHSVVLRC
ncbi:hypothetical protein [Streptomyces sp. BA2]|uniref:hypothetical protein n=1 Tax=Streptomyces sp. BA2 TaxID=436595 RepID=UPI0013231918|nr:hypothetical protein [Streptomyces sp. BA2]MWA12185.1 hypothetical protein [Streptomyces sp. BA2]